MYAIPHTTTIDMSLLPTPPDGWKFANLVDPYKTDANFSRYPILLFGPYTYTGVLPPPLLNDAPH